MESQVLNPLVHNGNTSFATFKLLKYEFSPRHVQLFYLPPLPLTFSTEIPSFHVISLRCAHLGISLHRNSHHRSLPIPGQKCEQNHPGNKPCTSSTAQFLPWINSSFITEVLHYLYRSCLWLYTKSFIISVLFSPGFVDKWEVLFFLWLVRLHLNLVVHFSEVCVSFDCPENYGSTEICVFLPPWHCIFFVNSLSFFLACLLMIIGKKKLSHMNVFPCLRSVSFLTALSPLNPTRSPFSTPINAYFTWVSWNLTLPTELPSLSFIYFSKLLLWFVRLVQSMYIFCQTQVNSVNHTPLGIGIFSVACVKVLSKIKIIWLRPASLQAKLIFLSFHGV